MWSKVTLPPEAMWHPERREQVRRGREEALQVTLLKNTSVSSASEEGTALPACARQWGGFGSPHLRRSIRHVELLPVEENSEKGEESGLREMIQAIKKLGIIIWEKDTLSKTWDLSVNVWKHMEESLENNWDDLVSQ